MPVACRVCSAEVSGTAVTCRPCVDLLLDDVRVLLGWTTHDGRRITGLLDDLVITATRQDRIPAQGSHRDTREERTLDHRYAVAVAVTAAPCRFDALALRRDVLLVIDEIRRGVRQLGAARLHQHQDAARWVNQISATNGYRLRVERLVDRPDGAFRVPCPQCQHRVPMDTNKPIIRCSSCKQEWGDIQWWVSRVAPEIPADDDVMTAQDGCTWLAARHGIAINASTVRQWAVRYPDRLPRIGKDDRGRTIYSARHLLDIAETMSTRRACA